MRRTLPPPILLTLLLALTVRRVFLLVPVVPSTLVTARVNLATENFLLGKNEQLVNGGNQHFVLAVDGSTSSVSGSFFFSEG